MIFNYLYEHSEKGNLILIEGGMCVFNIRRDRQLTIYVIISQKPGAGTKMLNILKEKDCDSIFAKCPVELDSNDWYRKRGFILENCEELSSGKKVNHWRYRKRT